MLTVYNQELFFLIFSMLFTMTLTKSVQKMQIPFGTADGFYMCNRAGGKHSHGDWMKLLYVSWTICFNLQCVKRISCHPSLTCVIHLTSELQLWDCNELWMKTCRSKTFSSEIIKLILGLCDWVKCISAAQLSVQMFH